MTEMPPPHADFCDPRSRWILSVGNVNCKPPRHHGTMAFVCYSVGHGIFRGKLLYIRRRDCKCSGFDPIARAFSFNHPQDQYHPESQLTFHPSVAMGSEIETSGQNTPDKKRSDSSPSVPEKREQVENAGTLLIVDSETERRLLRKLDIRIIPMICWIYLMNFMDRGRYSLGYNVAAC